MTDALDDSQITISASKAKEMGIKKGDVVVLIGRRRKASYAKVAIARKMGKTGCKIPFNLAKNLRLRNGDKVKLAVLEKDESEDKDSRSGDLLLLTQTEVPSVNSVTFAPIEDSLKSLEMSEGGDEIPDEEIQMRFLEPYLAGKGGAVVKKGHVLILRDEDGKQLEFMITNVGIEGVEEEEEQGRYPNPHCHSIRIESAQLSQMCLLLFLQMKMMKPLLLEPLLRK